ncbi:Glu-tRNA(Gln) amidotransferase GatDE subunit E [Candidatus Woesearchaeota archaeon]|nr:MAG: Glu-tRNA(Gln) amidotransferase GatDE subunit E [Candidatus Woesearchaeota archaeon]
MEKEQSEYEKIGLKCGLECHQQFDVGKLFCSCKSILHEDEPDFTFERYIRPVPSELGTYDKAALEAFEKGLKYEYEVYDDCCCLVEMDEEPPHPINEEALKIAFQVALKINAEILDEIIVMRKGIFDGSNVSGFQRTALVALGGKIPLKNKAVDVETIVLEEDSARIIRKEKNKIVYRLDRLGIPLIELATAPQLTTPEEVKECALKIGELFRITCKAKRGLGSIRQDLNISIKGGNRVEIKGIQDLELMDEVVRREVIRQKSLIEIKEILKERNLKKEELVLNIKSLGNELSRTNSAIIKAAFKKGFGVFGIKLPKFKGILAKEIQPGRRFGTELASYVKARTKLKGIIHSDELPGYGISAEDVKKIEKDLEIGKEDGFVLVVGEELECAKALEIVLERCKQALIGVPKETRAALKDGNSEYTRILSGASRMYPETDIPRIEVSSALLEELKANLPLWASERKKLYLSYGLSEKLAEEMKLSNYAIFFENLVKKGFDANMVASILLETITAIKREGYPTENLSEEMLEEFFKKLTKEIPRELAKDVLKLWSRKPNLKLDQVLKELKVETMEESKIEHIVKELVRKNNKLIKEKGKHAFNALMGDAMKLLRGKASGHLIAKLLKEEIEKVLE